MEALQALTSRESVSPRHLGGPAHDDGEVRLFRKGGFDAVDGSASVPGGEGMGLLRLGIPRGDDLGSRRARGGRMHAGMPMPNSEERQSHEKSRLLRRGF